jgi:hypothetical protein
MLIIAGVALLSLSAAEIYHRERFGHFVGYGLHTDVILGDSDVGTKDMHYARLWNLSFEPFEIEGCISPSDVGGVPDSVAYRWDVQKRDSSNQWWVSLRGANTWVQKPFGGNWDEVGCSPVMTRIRPFQSRKVAWVYKDWVTTGDPIRMAIQTSVRVPPESQRIVYTDMFVLTAHTTKKP